MVYPCKYNLILKIQRRLYVRFNINIKNFTINIDMYKVQTVLKIYKLKGVLNSNLYFFTIIIVIERVRLLFFLDFETTVSLGFFSAIFPTLKWKLLCL
jgi:hypothetical protein